MRRHSKLAVFATGLLWSWIASAQEAPPATTAPADTQPAATAPAAAPPAETATTPPPQGTLTVPEKVSSAPIERPSRGQTMESVKAKFGTPSQEGSSVGAPPISRWEYPGYVVFFENDKVLHTVIMR